MNNKRVRSRTAWRIRDLHHSALTRAAIFFIRIRQVVLGLALSACFIGVVQAQSNAAGSIFGNVSEGEIVIVSSTETGLSREVPVEDGRFSVTQLPIGTYTVTLKNDGQTVATRENVLVRIGAGSNVSFTEGATELAAIRITGGGISPIDVSTTDTRTVFTSQQLARIPVGRSIQEVALLTPGVVEADSRYPGTASFGGSAASENAFYINGYAVTNPLTNMGSTSLPFDSIGQFQAITGGYGAEFGRATGGVVNIITKGGTNEYKGGAYLFWEPNSLRGKYRNIYYPENNTPRDGLLYQNRAERELDIMTYGAYASGPIMQDKLFFYANVEYTDESLKGDYGYPGYADGAYDVEYEIPRYLVKLDWNITNSHLLDLTVVSDVEKQTDEYYQYYYPENVPAGVDLAPLTRGDKTGGYYYEDGGELYVLNYTGYLTNDLTLSAMYGTQRSDHIAVPEGYDPSVVHVSDSRDVANPVSGGLYAQIPTPDAYDETEGYRLDVEWQVGDHSLRLGYDRQDSESKTGEVTSGPEFLTGSFGTTGYRWIYEDSTEAIIPGSPNTPTPADGDFVTRYVYANGGTFSVEQSAFYLEDRWQINYNWLLSLGLRNERFTNFNSDGVAYAEQDNQWAPRVGATWDVFGDSTLKVFGQIGRYHLAMPMNVAVRAASGSYYTRQYFEFESIDPNTGIPLGLTQLSEPYSANNEYGQAADPNTVAASDLDSHFQDELVIGAEHLLAGTWNVGARWVYRDLKSAIDDMCDGRPGYRWAIENGYSEADALAFDEQLQGCRMFNPGEANTFVLGNDAFINQGPNAPGAELVTLNLSADDLGFPELKRTYNGIDVFLEYPFDGTWYYKIDYTWSQNYGNAEGQLKSDIGQDDVSITQDWDHPELMENSNGYLPNHRKHYLKAFGYYQMNPEWRFSSTFITHSGRPKNCFGYYNGPNADDPDFHPYPGPYYFFCDGETSRRGSRGNLPWTYRLDLGVAYAPAMFDNKLQFGLDVFNVTDRQTAQNIVEYGELGGFLSDGAYYHSTNRVLSYSDPRAVRFSVRYDF